MLIVGAGMAGLLAGHILRRHRPLIVEAQESLPNNHAALLRFKTPKVSEATGIPFLKVYVRKAVMTSKGLSDRPSLADNNEYSIKVTGEALDRSVLDLSPGERYIAPEDFISQMESNLNIQFGYKWNPTRDEFDINQPEDGTIISTVPMPTLMKMVEWPAIPEFKHKRIWTVTAYVEDPPASLYQTIYYPDRRRDYYRASLTGNRLSLEYIQSVEREIAQMDVMKVLDDFGIYHPKWNMKPLIHYHEEYIKAQFYGKLLPIDEMERKAFIIGMTDKYDIWSLGRFATWRQILLDDVVDDVKFIDRVVTQKDQYHRRMHHHNS